MGFSHGLRADESREIRSRDEVSILEGMQTFIARSSRMIALADLCPHTCCPLSWIEIHLGTFFSLADIILAGAVEEPRRAASVFSRDFLCRARAREREKFVLPDKNRARATKNEYAIVTLTGSARNSYSYERFRASLIAAGLRDLKL